MGWRVSTHTPDWPLDLSKFARLVRCWCSRPAPAARRNASTATGLDKRLPVTTRGSLPRDDNFKVRKIKRTHAPGNRVFLFEKCLCLACPALHAAGLHSRYVQAQTNVAPLEEYLTAGGVDDEGRKDVSWDVYFVGNSFELFRILDEENARDETAPRCFQH